MDDRQERKGALNSLSFHMSKILDLCKNNADMLEALEELEIISEEEMEDANDREDYGTVLEKLRSKIDKDPNFIVEFCRRLQSLDDDELAGLGKNILGEFIRILTVVSLGLSPSAHKGHRYDKLRAYSAQPANMVGAIQSQTMLLHSKCSISRPSPSVDCLALIQKGTMIRHCKLKSCQEHMMKDGKERGGRSKILCN